MPGFASECDIRPRRPRNAAHDADRQVFFLQLLRLFDMDFSIHPHIAILSFCREAELSVRTDISMSVIACPYCRVGVFVQSVFIDQSHERPASGKSAVEAAALLI